MFTFMPVPPLSLCDIFVFIGYAVGVRLQGIVPPVWFVLYAIMPSMSMSMVFFIIINFKLDW